MFQHLSNSNIQKALDKITPLYRYLVLTEHVPFGDFIPNLEKPDDHTIRLDVGSGVDVTRPPFRFSPAASATLCGITAYGGAIITTVHRLRD